MALRVLLADESPTIKKAIQLALQDFAVDVRAVNIGDDVLNITRSFKPDIIFSDVLLQKMNGYEVAKEVKQHPETSYIPVVLMWSGFMSIDEAKFADCGADDKIEKPFDVNSLRQMVKSLVPKTQQQNLSNYLKFPNMPEFDEKPTSQATEVQQSSMQSPQQHSPRSLKKSVEQNLKTSDSTHTHWNMDSFEPSKIQHDEVNEFQEVPLKKAKTSEPHLNQNNELNGEKQNLAGLEVAPEFQADAEENFDFGTAKDFARTQASKETKVELQLENPGIEADSGFEAENSFAGFSRTSLQEITKQQIEDYIEKELGRRLEQALSDMIPTMAKQMIQEEINRLTKED